MHTPHKIEFDVAPVANQALQAKTFSDSIAVCKIPVTTDEQEDWAAKVLIQLSSQRKTLAAQLEAGVTPLLAVVNLMRSWFPIAAIDEVIAFLRSSIAEYRSAKKQRLAAALAAAATPAEVAATVAAVIAPPEGMHDVEHWTWEQDPTLGEIPDDYWLLDTKRLDREAKAMKAGLRVPGIRPKRADRLARNATRS